MAAVLGSFLIMEEVTMKKLSGLVASTIILFSSATFADMMMDDSCRQIVNACKSHGFNKDNDKKNFWMNCMKPILLNQSVSGIHVDPAQVKTCREKKIEKMQEELKALQDVNS